MAHSLLQFLSWTWIPCAPKMWVCFTLKGYFIPIFFLFKHTLKLVFTVLPKLYLRPVIYTSYYFLLRFVIVTSEKNKTSESRVHRHLWKNFFEHLPSITCVSSRNGNKYLIHCKNIRSEETIFSFPWSTPILWYFSISQQQLKEASHTAISFKAICSLHLITLVLHDEFISL